MARAEYDFSAASDEEISLRTGDMINLAPKGENCEMVVKLFFFLASSLPLYIKVQTCTRREDFTHVTHS